MIFIVFYLKDTARYFLQIQIGRFGAPQREIGVSDKNIPYFYQKVLTLLVKEES